MLYMMYFSSIVFEFEFCSSFLSLFSQHWLSYCAAIFYFFFLWIILFPRLVPISFVNSTFFLKANFLFNNFLVFCLFRISWRYKFLRSISYHHFLLVLLFFVLLDLFLHLVDFLFLRYFFPKDREKKNPSQIQGITMN